jgi:hypothetical protein
MRSALLSPGHRAAVVFRGDGGLLVGGLSGVLRENPPLLGINARLRFEERAGAGPLVEAGSRIQGDALAALAGKTGCIHDNSSSLIFI